MDLSIRASVAPPLISSHRRPFYSDEPTTPASSPSSSPCALASASPAPSPASLSPRPPASQRAPRLFAGEAAQPTSAAPLQLTFRDPINLQKQQPPRATPLDEVAPPAATRWVPREHEAPAPAPTLHRPAFAPSGAAGSRLLPTVTDPVVQARAFANNHFGLTRAEAWAMKSARASPDSGAVGTSFYATLDSILRPAPMATLLTPTALVASVGGLGGAGASIIGGGRHHILSQPPGRPQQYASPTPRSFPSHASHSGIEGGSVLPLSSPLDSLDVQLSSPRRELLPDQRSGPGLSPGGSTRRILSEPGSHGRIWH